MHTYSKVLGVAFFVVFVLLVPYLAMNLVLAVLWSQFQLQLGAEQVRNSALHPRQSNDECGSASTDSQRVHETVVLWMHVCRDFAGASCERCPCGRRIGPGGPYATHPAVWFSYSPFHAASNHLLDS